MTDKGMRILDLAEQAARDGFRSIALRTEFMTPQLAAQVLRRLPAEQGFPPEKIAEHLEQLPQDTGAAVIVGKSTGQAFIIVSIPHDPRDAFEWARELIDKTAATSIKMNFGPDKATDVKIFWGKPEVNTLVAVGGDELD